MNEYGEGFESLEEFAESFQDGNELTDGAPMPEWGKIIEAIIPLMRDEGYDAEDMINGLSEDLTLMETILKRLQEAREAPQIKINPTTIVH